MFLLIVVDVTAMKALLPVEVEVEVEVEDWFHHCHAWNGSRSQFQPVMDLQRL